MPILGEMAKALGSGCGTVDSAVISETRWTGFESNHQQLLLYIFNVYRKDETKEKEAGNDPFEKDCQKQDRLDSQNAFVAKIRTYVEKFSFSCKLNISFTAWHFSFLMAKYQFLSLSLCEYYDICVSEANDVMSQQKPNSADKRQTFDRVGALRLSLMTWHAATLAEQQNMFQTCSWPTFARFCALGKGETHFFPLWSHRQCRYLPWS